MQQQQPRVADLSPKGSFSETLVGLARLLGGDWQQRRLAPVESNTLMPCWSVGNHLASTLWLWGSQLVQSAPTCRMAPVVDANALQLELLGEPPVAPNKTKAASWRPLARLLRPVAPHSRCLDCPPTGAVKANMEHADDWKHGPPTFHAEKTCHHRLPGHQVVRTDPINGHHGRIRVKSAKPWRACATPTLLSSTGHVGVEHSSGN